MEFGQSPNSANSFFQIWISKIFLDILQFEVIMRMGSNLLKHSFLTVGLWYGPQAAFELRFCVGFVGEVAGHK